MRSSTPDNSSLIQSLEADHRRIETLLARIDDLNAAGQRGELASAVEELDVILSRHLYAENEVLVPELELVTESVESEAVILVLQEHERIQSQLLGLRHRAARQASREQMGIAVERLRRTLAEHNRFEERLVYPLLGDLHVVHARAATVRNGGEDEVIFGDSLVP